MSGPAEHLVEISRKDVWATAEAEAAFKTLTALRDKARADASAAFYVEIGQITRAERERRELQHVSELNAASREIDETIRLLRLEHLTVVVTYHVQEAPDA